MAPQHDTPMTRSQRPTWKHFGTVQTGGNAAWLLNLRTHRPFGLVPGERSRGETTRRGGITKTGNSHAPRTRVEADLWTKAGRPAQVRPDRSAAKSRSRRRGKCQVGPGARDRRLFAKLLYKPWARIEQMMGKIKRFKCIALRCEKKARNCASFLALVNALTKFD
jgi:hypothetical protein